ncbi:hypothetical protein JHK86_010093 [Glycine max]|nr:hypothetical protein JHK86_010093 [Glycine max]
MEQFLEQVAWPGALPSVVRPNEAAPLEPTPAWVEPLEVVPPSPPIIIISYSPSREAVAPPDSPAREVVDLFHSLSGEAIALSDSLAGEATDLSDSLCGETGRELSMKRRPS